jgi:hypothetical protein
VQISVLLPSYAMKGIHWPGFSLLSKVARTPPAEAQSNTNKKRTPDKPNEKNI